MNPIIEDTYKIKAKINSGYACIYLLNLLSTLKILNTTINKQNKIMNNY